MIIFKIVFKSIAPIRLWMRTVSSKCRDEAENQSSKTHKQKEVKTTHVALAHAFPDPGTMMIVSCDADIADVAMIDFVRADCVADLAITRVI